MGKKKELLDTLAESVGCTYLSDLRQPDYRREAVSLLKTLHRKDYPAPEWRAAAVYLGQPELVVNQ